MLIGLAFPIVADAQQNCSITNPMVLDATQVNAASIASAIKQHNRRFTKAEIDQLKLQLTQCNSNMNSNISELKSKLVDVSELHKSFLPFRDVEGVKKQIEEKRKALIETEKAIFRDLENITLQSLYIVYMDRVDILNGQVEDWTRELNEYMSPQVIGDINGVFIESTTIVKDAALLQDHIKKQVSGELTASSMNTVVDAEKEFFVNFSRVIVSPLKKEKNTLDQRQASNSNRTYKIINPLNESSWQLSLRNLQIPENKINDFANQVEAFQKEITLENERQLKLQRNLLEKGKQQIKLLEQEIRSLEDGLRSRDVRVDDFMRQYPNLNYHKGNTDANVRLILSHLDKERSATLEAIRKEKEKEYVMKSDILVQIQGDTREALAQQAMFVLSQIRKNETVIQDFYEKNEIQDGKLTEQERLEARRLYRDPDKIWIFPSPGQGDQYKLALVVTFKVRSGPSTGQSVTVQPNLSSSNNTPQTTGTSAQTSPGAGSKPPVEAPISDNRQVLPNGLTLDPTWPTPIQELVRNMVKIPAGKFVMGSPTTESKRESNEGPQQEISLAGFYMNKYEVTVAQFRAFVEKINYQTDAEKIGSSYFWKEKEGKWQWVEEKGINWRHDAQGNFQVNKDDPVIHVSWNDAQAFIQWLNKLTNYSFQLPSEAQWEYVCRAGTTTPFNTGDCLSTTDANYDGNYPYEGCSKGTYLQSTNKVGSYKANAWGLYDMHGNVREWCQDWYHDSYTGIPTDGKAWESPTGSNRVLRGGGWFNFAQYCRSANRGYNAPDYRSYGAGFRLLSSGTP